MIAAITLIMLFADTEAVQAVGQNWSNNVISGVIGAVCGSLPFIVKELFGLRKGKAEVNLTDAKGRQTDAETIRNLATDLQNTADRYRGLGDRIRSVEETSDRRYRKLRNYVLDMMDIFEDALPLIAKADGPDAERVLNHIKNIQDTAHQDLERERKIYERENAPGCDRESNRPAT